MIQFRRYVAALALSGLALGGVHAVGVPATDYTPAVAAAQEASTGAFYDTRGYDDVNIVAPELVQSGTEFTVSFGDEGSTQAIPEGESFVVSNVKESWSGGVDGEVEVVAVNHADNTITLRVISNYVDADKTSTMSFDLAFANRPELFSRPVEVTAYSTSASLASLNGNFFEHPVQIKAGEKATIPITGPLYKVTAADLQVTIVEDSYSADPAQWQAVVNADNSISVVAPEDFGPNEHGNAKDAWLRAEVTYPDGTTGTETIWLLAHTMASQYEPRPIDGKGFSHVSLASGEQATLKLVDVTDASLLPSWFELQYDPETTKPFPAGVIESVTLDEDSASGLDVKLNPDSTITLTAPNWQEQPTGERSRWDSTKYPSFNVHYADGSIGEFSLTVKVETIATETDVVAYSDHSSDGWRFAFTAGQSSTVGFRTRQGAELPEGTQVSLNQNATYPEGVTVRLNDDNTITVTVAENSEANSFTVPATIVYPDTSEDTAGMYYYLAGDEDSVVDPSGVISVGYERLVVAEYGKPVTSGQPVVTGDVEKYGQPVKYTLNLYEEPRFAENLVLDENTGVLTFTPEPFADDPVGEYLIEEWDLGRTATVQIRAHFEGGETTTAELNIELPNFTPAASENTFSYQDVEVNAGERVKLTPTGTATTSPRVVKFTVGESYTGDPAGFNGVKTEDVLAKELQSRTEEDRHELAKWILEADKVTEGWVASLNDATGEVYVDVPADAKDGDTVYLVIGAEYDDGSLNTSEVELIVGEKATSADVNLARVIETFLQESFVIAGHASPAEPAQFTFAMITDPLLALASEDEREELEGLDLRLYTSRTPEGWTLTEKDGVITATPTSVDSPTLVELPVLATYDGKTEAEDLFVLIDARDVVDKPITVLTPGQQPTPAPTPGQQPTPAPTPDPQPTPTPDPQPTPTPDTTPDPQPTPDPTPDPTPTSEPQSGQSSELDGSATAGIISGVLLVILLAVTPFALKMLPASIVDQVPGLRQVIDQLPF